MAQICNRTRLKDIVIVGHHRAWGYVHTYLYDIYRVRGECAGPRHNSRSAPTPQPVHVCERRREKRERRRARSGEAAPCFVRYGYGLYSPLQLCVRVRVGGGIELVALLTADVRASVPFSSVDRWVRVLRQQVRIHHELGIKTSYMCVVLGSYIYSTALVPVQDASHNPDLLGCVMRGLRCKLQSAPENPDGCEI